MPQFGATFYPGGMDDYLMPEVLAPLPQRCVFFHLHCVRQTRQTYRHTDIHLDAEYPVCYLLALIAKPGALLVHAHYGPMATITATSFVR